MGYKYTTKRKQTIYYWFFYLYSFYIKCFIYKGFIILKFNPFKKKTFNIYCIYINDKTKHKHLVKEFDKDFDARNSLRYTIEERLKELCPKAKNDIELIEVYLKSRKYIYKIENDDFNEDDYAKEIASRVYNQFIDRTIDGGFEKYNKKEELSLLNDIEDSQVISVNEKDKFIEIIYEKENEERYLTIEQSSHISSQNGTASFFILDNKKLQDTKDFKTFNDISKIVKIFHLAKLDNNEVYFRKDIIEIIYKNVENQTNSYRLTLSFDYDAGIELLIKKYENIFYYKTRILDDKYRTELNYSYDKKYFSPELTCNDKEEVEDKSSPTLIKRKKWGYYYLDSPCTTFGKKVYFIKEEDDGILAYNISHHHVLNPFSLPSKEIYNCLNEEEKSKLHHFLAIAQLYLNDVYVNREFDNQLIIDTFENTKDIWKLDKLDEILENSNWIQKRYYDDAEQGHPAGMLVDIYHKENDKNKNFVLFNENDWISFKYTVKYNNDVKDEVEMLLKDVMWKN